MLTPSFRLRRLGPGDLPLFKLLNSMFGDVFDEKDTYTGARPTDAYARRLLGNNSFIALAALKGDAVVGGLAAYVLTKFEQERREIYIYDLAVAAAHRRQGIATALIEDIKLLAAELGAYAVFVQADAGDSPAIALYEKLGRGEAMVHFDIDLAGRVDTGMSLTAE